MDSLFLIITFLVKITRIPWRMKRLFCPPHIQLLSYFHSDFFTGFIIFYCYKDFLFFDYLILNLLGDFWLVNTHLSHLKSMFLQGTVSDLLYSVKNSLLQAVWQAVQDIPYRAGVFSFFVICCNPVQFFIQWL